MPRRIDQGGRGAHHHDDGGFDQDGQGEGHAVGGQVVLGIGQAGDDRRQEGAFQGHHQPGGLQGQPEAEQFGHADGVGHGAKVAPELGVICPT